MIVKDKYDLHYEVTPDLKEFEYDNFDGNVVRSNEFDLLVTKHPDQDTPFASILAKIEAVNNKIGHRQLRNDLKRHLFEHFPLYKKKLQR